MDPAFRQFCRPLDALECPTDALLNVWLVLRGIRPGARLELNESIITFDVCAHLQATYPDFRIIRFMETVEEVLFTSNAHWGAAPAETRSALFSRAGDGDVGVHAAWSYFLGLPELPEGRDTAREDAPAGVNFRVKDGRSWMSMFYARVPPRVKFETAEAAQKELTRATGGRFEFSTIDGKGEVGV